MTFKRKCQERIKGINEILERFSPTSAVAKALEPIKEEYQQALEKEIKYLAKHKKVAATSKSK